MKSKNIGKNISQVEVNTSNFGVWLLINQEEYFLPYKDFPWFRDAKISEIHDIKLFGKDHLHWPKLDVDLHLESLVDVEKYPLIYY